MNVIWDVGHVHPVESRSCSVEEKGCKAPEVVIGRRDGQGEAGHAAQEARDIFGFGAVLAKELGK